MLSSHYSKLFISMQWKHNGWGYNQLHIICRLKTVTAVNSNCTCWMDFCSRHGMNKQSLVVSSPISIGIIRPPFHQSIFKLWMGKLVKTFVAISCNKWLIFLTYAVILCSLSFAKMRIYQIKREKVSKALKSIVFTFDISCLSRLSAYLSSDEIFFQKNPIKSCFHGATFHFPFFQLLHSQSYSCLHRSMFFVLLLFFVFNRTSDTFAWDFSPSGT